ncbi:MAG: 3-hydroxyacyl-CoA dehydrogenase, partial [Bacteroidia bacterium]
MEVIQARNRKIKSVAILGSGIMGSRLACHFANIGLKVYLLDIVPFDLTEDEKSAPSARNRIVEAALKTALKSNPSPVYSKSVSKNITTGNFDDNMDWLSKVDWTIEAVIENLKIKKEVFEKVEQFRKPGTLVSSNTSGIPISMMLDGRSDDFQAHFAGTHFFNPPRYLRLLEIIPTAKTHPEVTSFLMHFGDLFLGKQTVLCKDTPAFIANRIGVFSIMAIFHLMQEMDLTVEEVDAITGPISGRPKSATFRTCDLVGIDTLVKVAMGVGQNCPNDEAKDLFEIPDFVQRLVDNKWLGDKTRQGFYKKSKDEKGKTVIEALNLSTFEYKPKLSPRFESIGAARNGENLVHKLKILAKGSDK